MSRSVTVQAARVLRAAAMYRSRQAMKRSHYVRGYVRSILPVSKSDRSTDQSPRRRPSRRCSRPGQPRPGNETLKLVISERLSTLKHWCRSVPWSWGASRTKKNKVLVLFLILTKKSQKS